MNKSLNRCLVLAALALLLTASACVLEKDAAKTRVENVLNGLMKDDQAVEYQTAICQWFDGTYAMNQGDLEVAMGQFEAWLKQKGLKAPIQSFTIDKVTVRKGAKAPTAVVDVTVDGSTLRILVVKDEPLSWVNEGE